MCFYSLSDKRSSLGACKMKTKLNSNRYVALKAELWSVDSRLGRIYIQLHMYVQYRATKSRAASATRSRI